MAVDIRLACERLDKSKKNVDFGPKTLVSPGDVISSATGFMRGHGTYVEKDRLVASVAGYVERVNKLISVRPLKTRYNGEIGDVVVGRISEVQQRRWKVQTNSRLDSVLMLSSVNLPGGELRRKTAEDERMMREYLMEGDLISAEVQSIFSDGSLSLHTRSLKYGKLCQGVLLRISPSLIRRSKTHFHNLPFGAHIILGNNGYIWICPTVNQEDESGGYAQNINPVAPSDREAIARLHNCILAMAEHRIMLYDTSVVAVYEASLSYEVKDMLKPEVCATIAEIAEQSLELHYK